jgi:hypothetical protein
MSEELIFGDALENIVTETPLEQTENPQPIKTDVDELIEYFSQFATEKEAKQAMKQNVNDKRFFMPTSNKDYSTANCYKAITRCREKGLFKGQTITPEAKDLTYKMEVPPTPPQQEQEPLTPPPEYETIENIDAPDTFVETDFSQPPQQEPIDPKAAKKNGQLIQGVLNLLADYFEEPKAKINDKEAIEYGEDLVILCPNLANSKNAAAAHLIGGLILTRGAILAPKAYAKITSTLKDLKEGKKQ